MLNGDEISTPGYISTLDMPHEKAREVMEVPFETVCHLVQWCKKFAL